MVGYAKDNKFVKILNSMFLPL